MPDAYVSEEEFLVVETPSMWLVRVGHLLFSSLTLVYMGAFQLGAFLWIAATEATHHGGAHPPFGRGYGGWDSLGLFALLSGAIWTGLTLWRLLYVHWLLDRVLKESRLLPYLSRLVDRSLWPCLWAVGNYFIWRNMYRDHKCTLCSQARPYVYITDDQADKVSLVYTILLVWGIRNLVVQLISQQLSLRFLFNLNYDLVAYLDNYSLVKRLALYLDRHAHKQKASFRVRFYHRLKLLADACKLSFKRQKEVLVIESEQGGRDSIVFGGGPNPLDIYHALDMPPDEMLDRQSAARNSVVTQWGRLQTAPRGSTAAGKSYRKQISQSERVELDLNMPWQLNHEMVNKTSQSVLQNHVALTWVLNNSVEFAFPETQARFSAEQPSVTSDELMTKSGCQRLASQLVWLTGMVVTEDDLAAGLEQQAAATEEQDRIELDFELDEIEEDEEAAIEEWKKASAEVVEASPASPMPLLGDKRSLAVIPLGLLRRIYNEQELARVYQLCRVTGGALGLPALTEGIARLVKDHHNLCISYEAQSHVERALSRILTTIITVTIIVVFLVERYQTTTTFVALFAALCTGMSTLLGGGYPDLVQCMMFVLFWNPYRVGDRVRINLTAQGATSATSCEPVAPSTAVISDYLPSGGVVLYPTKISMYHTEFRDSYGKSVIVTNKILAQKTVINESRSMKVKLFFLILLSPKSVTGKLIAFERLLREYIKRHPDQYNTEDTFIYTSGIAPDMYVELTIQVGSNRVGREAKQIRLDQSYILLKILGLAKKLNVRYRLPPQRFELVPPSSEHASIAVGS